MNLYDTAPASAPQSVTGHALDSTSIEVLWRPPPERDQNGIIHGYKIRYQEEAPLRRDQPVFVTVNASRRNMAIRPLAKWMPYKISVLAFTAAGDGPSSDPIIVTTEEDGRFVIYLNSLPLILYFDLKLFNRKPTTLSRRISIILK